jgi:hypothetical protein
LPRILPLLSELSELERKTKQNLSTIGIFLFQDKYAHGGIPYLVGGICSSAMVDFLCIYMESLHSIDG